RRIESRAAVAGVVDADAKAARHAAYLGVRLNRLLHDRIGAIGKIGELLPLLSAERHASPVCRRANSAMRSSARCASGWLASMPRSGRPVKVSTSIGPPRARYDATKRSCISCGWFWSFAFS